MLPPWPIRGFQILCPSALTQSVSMHSVHAGPPCTSDKSDLGACAACCAWLCPGRLCILSVFCLPEGNCGRPTWWLLNRVHLRPFVSATFDNWLGLQDGRRRPLVIRSAYKTIIAVRAQDCPLDEINIKNVLKQERLSQRKILPAIAKHFRSLRKDKL